jgi:uncharacterized membrane protein/AraC-like DNA-binding protein
MTPGWGSASVWRCFPTRITWCRSRPCTPPPWERGYRSLPATSGWCARRGSQLLAVLLPGLERAIEQDERARTLADDVRLALSQRMCGERPAVAKVAKSLGMSARTMQRRLGDLGTTYQDVLDDVRRRSAHQLLANESLGIGEVAFLLGFEEVNSFTVPFTPGKRRRRRSGERGRVSADGSLERGAQPTSAARSQVQRAPTSGTDRSGLRLMSTSESSFSKARLEAFSDGVMAVIITIMVLDLKAPRVGEPPALIGLWPSFAIYLVSFFLTALFWINHHWLMAHARRVTAGLLWANVGLLFWTSLVPFATAYVAETRLGAFPTAVYAGLQCACSITFNVMFRTIALQRDDEAFRQAAQIRWRRNIIAVAVYAVSTVVALSSPLVAILLLTAVSLAYLAPAFLDPR